MNILLQIISIIMNDKLIKLIILLNNQFLLSFY